MICTINNGFLQDGHYIQDEFKDIPSTFGGSLPYEGLQN